MQLRFLQQSFFAYLISFSFFLLMISPCFPCLFSICEFSLLSFSPIDWFSEVTSFSNLVSLGLVLYTYYFIFFLIAGFILLVAVFGVFNRLVHRAGPVRQRLVLQLLPRPHQQSPARHRHPASRLRRLEPRGRQQAAALDPGLCQCGGVGSHCGLHHVFHDDARRLDV